MKVDLAKTLLIVAAICGILQGLMTFIGGLIAAEDSVKDSSPRTVPMVGKYMCGFVRFSSESACNDKKMDRGWFKNVHDVIKDNVNIPARDDIKKLIGYEAVICYAVISGVLWMAGGAVSFLASSKASKSLSMIAFILFLIGYIVFIIIFGCVWNSVRKVEDDCKDFYNTCKDYKKGAIRSSREFLGYSICSFVLIMVAMILTVLPGVGMEEGAKAVEEPEPKKEEKREPAQAIPPPAVEQKKEAAPAKPPKPEAKTEVGKEFIDKFNRVNKYLADENKMKSYSEKQFKTHDADNSGALQLSEFKAFVTEIMTKKGLPPPPDDKIELLMKKYDKDKSGQLDIGEFSKMLNDVFIGSREVLIRKYAEAKAKSWKPTKGQPGDATQIANLEKLLKNANNFYVELDAVAKEVDKDKSATLNIDEVTELVAKFCTKYKVVTLKKDEIIEVMTDMGRPIEAYKPADLRMVAYAVLNISKSLSQ